MLAHFAEGRDHPLVHAVLVEGVARARRFLGLVAHDLAALLALLKVLEAERARVHALVAALLPLEEPALARHEGEVVVNVKLLGVLDALRELLLGAPLLRGQLHVKELCAELLLVVLAALFLLGLLLLERLLARLLLLLLLLQLALALLLLALALLLELLRRLLRRRRRGRLALGLGRWLGVSALLLARRRGGGGLGRICRGRARRGGRGRLARGRLLRLGLLGTPRRRRHVIVARFLHAQEGWQGAVVIVVIAVPVRVIIVAIVVILHILVLRRLAVGIVRGLRDGSSGVGRRLWRHRPFWWTCVGI
mmetsp:Transcript_15495/g.52264  ORF Transcript_15495/g.52264 Transcript_15495/m.52264 type:complete len:308 (-) Transcript_15495:154-1077(-)